MGNVLIEWNSEKILQAITDDIKLQNMIKIFVKLYIIIFINVNISVVTTHYLCGKVE